MHNEKFYRSKDKYGYDVTVEKYLGTVITEEDDKLIRRYMADKMVANQNTELVAIKNGQELITWRKYIKVSYLKMTIEDVKTGVAALKTGKTEKGKPYKQNSIRHYIKTLKAFIHWMQDENLTTITEKDLSKIKPPKVDYHTDSAENLLTQKDIDKMIEACINSRDRALIATCYETGARAGEISRLTWGDLTIKERSIIVKIDDEKTHQEKTAIIVAYLPLIMQYRNDKGVNVSSTDFVFLTRYNEPFSYDRMLSLVKSIAKKAGITKPIKTHLLRKSRITNMIKEDYKEAMIREMMWGRQDADQFKHYAKLNNKDLEDEVLAKNGVDMKKPKAEVLTKPFKCIFCSEYHAPNTKYCPLTGKRLLNDVMSMEEEISEADRELLKLLKNPKIVEKLQKMAED